MKLNEDMAQHRPAWDWVAATLLLAAATTLAWALDTAVSLTSLAMVYLMAVVLAAYLLGWVPAAFTAVAAVTLLNFFFVPPRWTFEVGSTDHLVALGTMLAVSLLISHLARSQRREAAQARAAEQRARQLQALATRLGTSFTLQDVHALGIEALRDAFRGPVYLALGDAVPPPPSLTAEVACSAPERDGLRQCIQDKAVLGPGTGRWPGLDGWYLPVGDAGQVFGAALVQPAHASDTDGLAHATALVALLGQAVMRLRLGSEMQRAQAQAHRQQVQNTFLAAISHDLRTPLASVVGAATALQSQGERLAPDARAALLDSIVSESTRLATLADNTLQLVRLSTHEATGSRPWESVEEIVGAAVARVRLRDPARRVGTQVQAALPLVRADAVLMGQLLANLLDNALRCSDGPVTVSAALEGEQLRLCVKDRGPGIDADQQADLFVPFGRGDLSGQQGAGLGLALCQAIARAHGGSLELRQRRGGGSAFCLLLPLEPQPGGDSAP